MSLHILALETSGNRCGVALLREHAGEVAVIHRAHDGVAEHSARLLPMVDQVLAEAGVVRSALDAVAFGQGPGGFTGLRVACGVAQGLGFALDIPVLPVGSHAAVEFRLPALPALRLIALDARMREAYVAVYRRGDTLCTLQPPILLAMETIVPWAVAHLPAWSEGQEEDVGLLIAGDVYAPEQDVSAGALADSVWPEPLRPDVDAVARLGLAAWAAGERPPADSARPLYVRDKVAFTIRERERGAGGNPRAGEPA